MTTRLMMILVALVAVGLWAAMDLPQLIETSQARHAGAEMAETREGQARAAQRTAVARASAIQSELDRWRADEESGDELTERYFASRYQFAVTDAEYRRAVSEYEAKLKADLRWARWFPWNSAPPFGAPPSDPVIEAPFPYEPGKISWFAPVDGGTSVAFLPSGETLVVGCKDRSVKMLELPSKRVMASLPLPEEFAHSVVSSSNGTTLFALGYPGHLIRRWDLTTMRSSPPIAWTDQARGQSGQPDVATAMNCSPDGSTIAVAAGGFQGTSKRPSTTTSIYTVRLLEVRSGAQKWEHKGTGNWPNSIAFAPDGKTLAFTSGAAAIVLDTVSGHVNRTMKPTSGSILGVDFSSDGRLLAGAGSAETLDPRLGIQQHGQVTLWNASTGTILRPINGPTGRAQKVAFAPDGRTVAAAGTGPASERRDKVRGARVQGCASEVRLWDVATGKLIWTMEGESDAASSLAFSPNGKMLAFCDQEYVYVIDAMTGRLKKVVMETVWKRYVRDQSPPAGSR
jgi:WD40 repeat protein